MSDINTSNLFVELSDEQEELISGGGPTSVFDVGIADFSFNNVTALQDVTAGPNGANAVGGIEASEIDSTAIKFLAGGAGFPTAVNPGGLAGLSGVIGAL
ncbi:MAG: CTB family bacteriocin [Gloeocapsa sp. UFS-A4-WI-NPMV-4B04]|jgi:hypothetical protein|nr:CTB family bacteriocin [Gloeocapsa sp. UFS-A4-WI-NPMV-4B04]